ncbi:MAG: insulinase family protein [Candidatus Moranbacteria bacterium]|nr:insulinase family protein [Candidatus Moranbacteria bacterium]
MIYKKTTLKNGLRILTIPVKGTQTATVMLMVGVGSRYESEKQAGLSHFIEHMLFKGTVKRPTAQSISEELDAIGGEFNAFTAKDKTAYYAKVDSKHIEKALDVVSDIFLNSKLEQAEINRERGPILQELSMYEDEPRRSVGDEFEKMLYVDQPIGRGIVGYKKTISEFKRKDFVAYMKKHYNANETVVCVAGKFKEDEILSQIKSYFLAFPTGAKAQMKKVVEKQAIPAVHLKFKKTDQTHFILGNRAYHQDHKDRYVLALLSIILGGNMSSRLFIEIRERRGLAYFVHTSVDTYQDCGYIATQAGVEHNKIEQAITAVLAEYKKVTTEKVGEKELQKAKDYVKGRAVMGLEASDDVAMFFIDQEMHKEKIMTPKEVFAKIDAVTVDDILRVGKDVFQNSKLNLAIVGPHKNNKKLQALLKI